MSRGGTSYSPLPQILQQESGSGTGITSAFPKKKNAHHSNDDGKQTQKSQTVQIVILLIFLQKK